MAWGRVDTREPMGGEMGTGMVVMGTDDGE